MKEITIRMNKKNVLVGNYIPYGALYRYLHNSATSEANKKFAGEHDVVGIIANEFRLEHKDENKFMFNCCMQTDHYQGNSSWMEDDWLKVTVLR